MHRLMAIILNYFISMNRKIYYKVLPLFLCLIYLGQPAIAQKLFPIDSFDISYPAFASTDKIGNIFISNLKGEILKYSSFGQLTDSYVPQKALAPTFFEAWQMLRVFVFNAKNQEYYYLDHYLNPSETYSLSKLNPGFVSFATPDEDNTLWLIDDTSISLKKYDLRSGNLLSETHLSFLLGENFQVYFMKAYQNKLFISEKNSGILVFDNLGNFIQKLPLEKVQIFNFLGDEIYYTKDQNLILMNLPTLETNKIPLPEIYPTWYSFFAENQVFILSSEKVYVYKIVGKGE